VPSTFRVTTTLDAVAADGRLSLREAITQANAHPGADTIVLPAGVYRLALTGADNTNAAGDLDVTDSTLFRGAGAGATIIDGQRLDRVFDIQGNAPSSIMVTFQGLTVRNGLADAGGGGGIRVGDADLVVRDCVVTGNRTSGDGGGISNAAAPGAGNVTLVHSTVNRNVARVGGGLSVQADGTGHGSVLIINGSTIRRNLAESGGGIFAGVATLTNSNVSGNSANGNGGGIFAENAVTLTGCAVNGNSAGVDAGGIDAGTASLKNSTVSGNSASNFGGGVDAGTVDLTSSFVRGNYAGRDGGGIEADTANLTNSSVSGNSAGRNGAGINAGGGTATLVRSTVSGNFTTSGGDGGGIFASVATLTNSTVSGNSAEDDGGIFAGRAALTNCTVSGNTAHRNAGGIEAFALTLLNATVTDNSAHIGGGVVLDNGGASNIRNTIIAQNLVDLDGAGPDVSGAFSSGGHNLIGDGSGSTGFANGVNGDMVGTADTPLDPRLGPLANNGGPTQTHALRAGSPAIDQGEETDAPATDQRGVGRPRDGDGNGSPAVDIGAFER
jgi:predicted outer membrane repeat protein